LETADLSDLEDYYETSSIDDSVIEGKGLQPADRDNHDELERNRRHETRSSGDSGSIPDPTDIVSGVNKRSPSSQWDVKAPGFENVTSEEAKIPVRFNPPSEQRVAVEAASRPKSLSKISWPKGVRDYVTRSFDRETQIENISWNDIEVKLKSIISDAAQNGQLDNTDWTTKPLPQQTILAEKVGLRLAPLELSTLPQHPLDNRELDKNVDILRIRSLVARTHAPPSGIDPDIPLCQTELAGNTACTDLACEGQHFRPLNLRGLYFNIPSGRF